MTRYVVVLPLLAACAEEETFAPSVTFLAPGADATVAAGDVAVSIVVDDFELVAPETATRAPAPLPWWSVALVSAARAHDDEGLPSGYCALFLDDVEVASLSDPHGTVSGVDAGAHALRCELRYADGDPLEPPVEATVPFTAE